MTSLPIVYGNSAQALKGGSSKTHTHNWTIFLRSPRETDLYKVVRRVAIKLHSSFDKPIRVLEEPPFELTEKGWGEFEAVIRIDFVDTNLKPVFLKHFLKLFGNESTIQLGKRHIVAETYDELVFPYQLSLSSSHPAPAKKTTYRNYAEEEEKWLETLEAAKTKVRHAIRSHREQIQEAEATARQLEEDIAQLEKGVVPEHLAPGNQKSAGKQ